MATQMATRSQKNLNSCSDWWTKESTTTELHPKTWGLRWASAFMLLAGQDKPLIPFAAEQVKKIHKCWVLAVVFSSIETWYFKLFGKKWRTRLFSARVINELGVNSPTPSRHYPLVLTCRSNQTNDNYGSSRHKSVGYSRTVLVLYNRINFGRIDLSTHLKTVS